MTWKRAALYLLPLLVAALTVLILLILGALGAECQGKDSGVVDLCNTGGDAQWIVLALGLLLTAISVVVWAVAMLKVLIRRRRSRGDLSAAGR